MITLPQAAGSVKTTILRSGTQRDTTRRARNTTKKTPSPYPFQGEREGTLSRRYGSSGSPRQKRSPTVLVTYQQLSFRFDEDGNLLPWEEEGPEARVVSVDEKPGIQALSPTADDPGPAPGVRGGAVTRDYEYRRRGTPALLAGIDLQDGTVEGVVRERHRSREFVELLEALDAKYPKGHVIRLVLDNHSVHRSRETRAWLEGHPGRFEMVFTPTHGSWPDVIEGFFGKMSRQMLRGIRVESLDELRERIEPYLKEVNARPVPHRWTWGIGERAAEAERVMQSS